MLTRSFECYDRIFMSGKYEMGAYLSSMITCSHNLQIGNGKAGENSFI